MEKIKFNVSSKTARLIGRENISDSNGAIIELVKNAYDADADSVYVVFDIIFENVPNEIIISETEKLFDDEEYQFLLSLYIQKGDILEKKENLSIEQENELKRLLFKKNQIIILDNGTGMNENIMKTVWMNIGTSDKEINTYSKKGRIKTGAKGIGRFALEKLSNITTVYSKQKGDNLVYWNLDWTQFEQKNLLDEINADINVLDLSFENVVSNYIDLSELKKRNITLESGTLIILSGTREDWGDRIYTRINNNLKSINPFGNVDIFNVYINNVRKRNYNFFPTDEQISKDDYDYIIKANYDGDTNMSITLVRNEVNLLARIQQECINSKVYKFNIDEFWERDAFKNYPYRKEDYASSLTRNYNVLDLVSGVDIDEFKKIGKFSINFYFLKSGRSEFSFIKDVKVNRRKKLLSSFSGIKIYRDNFKVRPYGEEGPMFDWLELGSRVQKSPAGVSHLTGLWRVNTYQLIGNVNISRIDNPNLVDMANREGLALNDSYFLFVELIHSIISKFEYDRQYVYREYKLWLDKKISAVSSSGVIEKSVIEEKEKNKKNEYEFSEEEYRDALYHSINENKQTIDIQRILMNFSSAGITANTFAHEMKSIATNLATRNEQLKICIDAILENREYDGIEYLNPYDEIEEGKKYDDLLSKWLKLIMDSVSKKNCENEKILLVDFLNELKEDWMGLLQKKAIYLNINCESTVFIECEKTDLYLIFNNLILNSAFFLEKEINGKNRTITISIKEHKDHIIIDFENNGPKLDEKYANIPDIIFEAGETTKENGTGLGLWICKTSVQRNNGEIHVMPYEFGFKIRIKWPKVEL